MMNELIKELQSQAFLQCKAFEDGSVIRTDEAFEKFAELIVKKCIDEIEIAKMCDPYTGEVFDCEINYRLDFTIDALKDDFGIK